MSGPDCNKCGEHFLGCRCGNKVAKFSSKMILNGVIILAEEEILKHYKNYCEQHPDDEQTDQEWLVYSSWVKARRTGQVFNEMD